jgi:hypothetical protein
MLVQLLLLFVQLSLFVQLASRGRRAAARETASRAAAKHKAAALRASEPDCAVRSDKKLARGKVKVL